jgi:multidrug resistance efflux pump
VAGRAYALLAAAALTACSGTGETAYSGTVQAQSAAVGSTIGGRVTEVRVADGDRVKKGDVILAFDSAEERAAYRAALDQAQAAEAALADLQAGTRAPDLARAQAQAREAQETYAGSAHATAQQLAALDNQARQARASADSAEAAARDARTNEQRALALYATGDTSAQSKDAAVTRAVQAGAEAAAARAAADAAENQRNAGYATLPRNEAAAQQSVAAARASYRSLAIGPRPDAVVQARAAASSSRANARSLAARLDQLTVRAPAAGVISALDLHVGDIVAPGAAVATVDEDGEPYVRVFVPQSQLGRWHPNGTVTVHSDAMPGSAIPGTIEAIDSRAQFTPQNVQTAEDRAELTFGVKVRIHEPATRVRGGTTATVTLS